MNDILGNKRYEGILYFDNILIYAKMEAQFLELLDLALQLLANAGHSLEAIKMLNHSIIWDTIQGFLNVNAVPLPFYILWSFLLIYQPPNLALHELNVSFHCCLLLEVVGV